MRTVLSSLLFLAAVPPLFAQQGAAVFRTDLASHYAAVEAELRAAPAPADPQVAARRAAAIDLLREYRLRGDFGRNHLAPDARVAQFVDADGRRCAVAFLLDRTGQGALTDAIAARANLAWVAELASNPQLQQWLATNGLSAVEAARIQGPGWGGGEAPPTNIPPPRPAHERSLPGNTRGGPGDVPRQAAPHPTTPYTPSQGSAPETADLSAPVVASRPAGGIALGALQAPQWAQWWEWNRGAYQVPEPRAQAQTRTAAVVGIDRGAAERLLQALATDQNGQLRSAATQALGRMAGPTDMLPKLLDDAQRDVQLAAVLTMGCTDAPGHLYRLAERASPHGAEADSDIGVALTALALVPEGPFRRMFEPTLVACLRDERPDVVAAAALVIAGGGAGAGRTAARDLLRSEAPAWRRALAANALVGSHGAEDIAALTARLGDSSPDVRRACAAALGRSRAPLALPALQTAYELERESDTRGALLLAIGDHGGTAAHAFLLGELTHGSKHLRALAALALGLWGHDRDDDDDVAAILRAANDDHNRDQRGGYLLALGMLRDPNAFEVLRQELAGAAQSSTRGAAATALGLLGDERAVPALRSAATADQCPWVRTQTLRALAHFGDAAIDTLHQVLRQDPLGDVQHAAGVALGGLRSPRVSRLLAAVATDATADVAARTGAALGLGRHFRRQDPRLPTLRFQLQHAQLPPLVAWASQQDL